MADSQYHNNRPLLVSIDTDIYDVIEISRYYGFVITSYRIRHLYHAWHAIDCYIDSNLRNRFTIDYRYHR